MARQINDIRPYPSRTLQEYLMLPSKISSDVSDNDIDLSIPLTKYRDGENPRLKLNVPILSAPMQSVTGPKMAIAMAKLGGAGVIYCSQPIEAEARMVKEVKDYKAGFVKPDVFSPEDSIESVVKRIKEKSYSTFPITEDGKPNGRLVGYLTRNDFDPKTHGQLRVKDRMLPLEKILYANVEQVTADGDLDLRSANSILMGAHQSSLPIVDNERNLLYVVFKRDVSEHSNNPLELVDTKKRLIVGGAINTHDYKNRIPALIESGVDFISIDTSQGYSDYVKDCLRFVNETCDTPIIAGNIVTKEGFIFLAENGADAVKVGMGSGSICITQDQIRVGRGQATAVIEVSEERDKYFGDTGDYIPICSDGGILTSGDIVIALALGADYAMAGRYFAGTEESNSEKVTETTKGYWGEGSSRAKAWAGKRYGQTSFEEGIEITIPYVGSLKEYMYQPLAQIKDSIRKAGSENIKELHQNSVLEALSPLSLSINKGKPLPVFTP